MEMEDDSYELKYGSPPQDAFTRAKSFQHFSERTRPQNLPLVTLVRPR